MSCGFTWRRKLTAEEAQLNRCAIMMLCRKFGYEFRRFIAWHNVIVCLTSAEGSPNQELECRVADDWRDRYSEVAIEIMLKFLSSSRFSAVDVQTDSVFDGTLPASFCCLEELELKLNVHCPAFEKVTV